MNRRVYPAEKLLDNDCDLSIPIYLDTTSWEQFKLWVKQNLPSFQKRLQDGLVLAVFEYEFSRTQPRLSRIYDEQKMTLDELEGISLEKELEDNLGIEFNDDEIDQNREAYVFEVQQVYFHDETNPILRSNHAEFLLLARHAARNAPYLRIVSAYPAFQRLVNAEVFLLPDQPIELELPADFDIFLELALHDDLRNKISSYYNSGHYSSAIFEASKELFEALREKTGKTSDGSALVNEVLKIETQYDPRSGLHLKTGTPSPFYKLNALSFGDEIGEHSAYYRFFLGLTDLFRNPNAHDPASNPFIQTRFNHRKTAIKMLCFLSMLFEQLDKGTL